MANARANLELAEGDFERAQMLFERKLLAKAEFDQRTAQVEVARRQYDIARNGALQQYQALLGARARVSLAKKALADTVVRSPFSGVVGQRLVSVGDYVARGTKVASVLRTNPLRVNLTVPQQYSTEVAVGRPVSLAVDAAPGQRFEGQVRYVSPALQADSRTLVVEALVTNTRRTSQAGLVCDGPNRTGLRASGRTRPESGDSNSLWHFARLRVSQVSAPRNASSRSANPSRISSRSTLVSRPARTWPPATSTNSPMAHV